MTPSGPEDRDRDVDVDADLARALLDLHLVTDTQRLLREGAQLTRRELGAQGVSILVLDPLLSEEPVVTSGHAPFDERLPEAELRGPTWAAAHAQETVHVPDLDVDGRWPRWSASALRRGTREVLSVGLATSGRRLGALTIFSDEPRQLARSDVRTVESIAEHLSAALGRWREVGHHGDIIEDPARGKEPPIHDQHDDPLARARSRLNVAASAGVPVYAYAPPGFGLGALLRSAIAELGLTTVVVTPPVATTELLGEDGQIAALDGSVVVVDDPDGVVGPQEAARLAAELGHPPLVVLGHAARPAWEIHRTSAVVPPSDLLASSAQGQGSVVDAVGGWPALVSLVDPASVADPPMEVTAQLRRRWWPHVPAAWMPTLVTLVAADGLHAGERNALPGIEATVLDALLDLTALRTTHGEALALVPALAQVVRDSLPDDVEATRSAVARARERLGTGDCGLGVAAARHDWASCARIHDRWWPELVFGGHRALVQQVALDAPEAALRKHAGLALRAEYLGRLPVGTVPFTRIRPRSPLAQLASDEAGITALRRTVVAMIGRRVHGHLAEARRIALSAERLADACRTADLGPTAAATPFWYLHAGLSCHLAGDTAAAGRMYRKGWQLRDRADLPFVARDLALKTAVLRATDGRTSEAQWWLERAQQESAPRGVAGAFTDVTEQAVLLLLALDSADLEAFDRVWDAVGDSYVRDEMWPFMVSAIVGRRLAGGDVSGARRALAEVHDIYPATSTAGGLHTTTMTLLAAEASLAAGRPAKARAETDGLPAVPAVQAFRALVEVVSGDPHESLRLVAAVDDSSASERDRLRLALVSAVAHRRLGDEHLAGETLEKAASAAHWTQFPMALSTVPRADVEALAEHAPTAAALLRTLDERGIHALVPETVELVRLSERERAVLQALVEHGSNDKIAQALFVSVNTVKTQLRSIYGKLGVSSRREAVVAAHAMGLLEDRSDERTDR